MKYNINIAFIIYHFITGMLLELDYFNLLLIKDIVNAALNISMVHNITSEKSNKIHCPKR